MTKVQLLKKMAQLESVNDHLISELSQVDHLMRLIGFTDGLETVKATARELIDQGYLHHFPKDQDIDAA